MLTNKQEEDVAAITKRHKEAVLQNRRRTPQAFTLEGIDITMTRDLLKAWIKPNWFKCTAARLGQKIPKEKCAAFSLAAF